MNAPKSDEVAQAAVAIIGGGTVLAALCWTWLAWRWQQRRPILPLVLRRRVPWDGLATLGIVLLFLALGSAVPFTVTRVLGVQPEIVSETVQDSDHLVVRLVRERPGYQTIPLCLMAVVVMAPLVEELLFRIVLQGWLETVASRIRRPGRGALRLLRDSMPILISSLLFSAVHARTAYPQMNLDYLLCVIGAGILYNLVFVVATIVLLRSAGGAAWRDMGIPTAWPELWRGVGQGLVACVAVFGPVYLVQGTAKALLPAALAPDPLGIFALALALGVLYFRTHNAVASVVLHMAFNAASMTLLLLSI